MVNKKRSCCWNITWLNIYLAILFLLSLCYSLLLSNQNQFVYLLINICHIPTKFMINKEKKHFSVVIYVCCIITCSEIFLSQDGVFLFSTGCIKKKFLMANDAYLNSSYFKFTPFFKLMFLRSIKEINRLLSKSSIEKN